MAGAGFQPAARTGKMPVPPNRDRFLEAKQSRLPEPRTRDHDGAGAPRDDEKEIFCVQLMVSFSNHRPQRWVGSQRQKKCLSICHNHVGTLH